MPAFWCVPRLANPPGGGGTKLLGGAQGWRVQCPALGRGGQPCLPFQGARRCGRAGTGAMARSELLPACRPQPRGGHVPPPPPAASPCLAWTRGRRRASKVYFTQGGGGGEETKRDKNFTVAVTYLQPTSPPKAAARPRGVGTTASARLDTAAGTEERDGPRRRFPPPRQHEAVFKLEQITPLPSPHRPTAARGGPRVKPPSLLQCSPHLTLLLLLQLHPNTPPSLNGTETRPRTEREKQEEI